ncbi:hypothetical protein Tco_0041515 [Tanacetum coccineum]
MILKKTQRIVAGMRTNHWNRHYIAWSREVTPLPLNSSKLDNFAPLSFNAGYKEDEIYTDHKSIYLKNASHVLQEMSISPKICPST